jgi:hypothetical protein
MGGGTNLNAGRTRTATLTESTLEIAPAGQLSAKVLRLTDIYIVYWNS